MNGEEKKRLEEEKKRLEEEKKLGEVMIKRSDLVEELDIRLKKLGDTEIFYNAKLEQLERKRIETVAQLNAVVGRIQEIEELKVSFLITKGNLEGKDELPPPKPTPHSIRLIKETSATPEQNTSQSEKNPK